jgi:hypothetical protein
MYFYVTTKSTSMSVHGHLPLTADEALAFIETAKKEGLTVEVRDDRGNHVSEEQLREARQR